MKNDIEIDASVGMKDGQSLSRRDTVKLMAVAGVATTFGVGFDGKRATAGSTDPLTLLAQLRERCFDDGWQFTLGDPTGASAVVFNDKSWLSVELPHDWSITDQPGASTDDSVTADPALFSSTVGPDKIGPFQKVPTSTGDQDKLEAQIAWTTTGIGWYRKTFSVEPLLPGEKVEVRFDGVNQNADVYLNGVHLGFHPYGYTSFTFDLTPHLKVGKSNVLAVRVNNSGLGSRWYAGSGIYRHVWLTRRRATSVPYSGLWVTTPSVSASRAVVDVVVTLESAWKRENVKIGLGIQDASGRFVGYAGQQQNVSAGTSSVRLRAIVQNPLLWSLESPTLYKVEVIILAGNLPSDYVSTTFGIRTITMDATNGLQLNGHTLKLNGGCVHSQNGFLGAMAIDRAEERRVELLKAAGFNAVRTSHNPPSPAFLDACDRLGLLVYEEAFDTWDQSKTPQDYSNYFSQYGAGDIANMVVRDRNHPSVFIWSIGNEIADILTPAGTSIGQSLTKIVKSLDRTRPVTAGGGFGTFSIDTNGAEWSYLDVADFHYNPAAYATAHALHPSTPMLTSESFPFSLYDYWQPVVNNSYVVGDFVWTAIDYVGESGIGWVGLQPSGSPLYNGSFATYQSFPWFNANCGDIDLVGVRKPQNYYRGVVVNGSPIEMLVQRPTPAETSQEIGIWGWPDELRSWTWPGSVGQLLLVNIYTTGDRVELLLNGTMVQRNPVATTDKMKTQFSVAYEPGQLVAIAYKGNRRIGVATLTTVGPATKLRLRPDKTRLNADRNDLSHVIVEVVDAAGRLVPDAVVNVSFDIQGDGEIIATGNANPRNMASFTQPHRYTYHGRALAIVRPFARRGQITLRAQAAGMSSDNVSLSVG